ncbi:hypothetical protein CJF32_00003809 [Rutstroemia sp. NJR-2017a WRK4]|nr:hypothetical protein CJF32_00003809 [Rutstroemia sp. NJR-2017a WRK4]
MTSLRASGSANYGMKIRKNSTTYQRIKRIQPSILKWMACSYRKLKPFELQDGLAFHTGNTVLDDTTKLSIRVLDQCKPLIEQGPSGTLNFVHFSAKDYAHEFWIDHLLRFRLPKFCNSPADAKALIQQLNHLTRSLKPQITPFDNPGANNDDLQSGFRENLLSWSQLPSIQKFLEKVVVFRKRLEQRRSSINSPEGKWDKKHRI